MKLTFEFRLAGRLTYTLLMMTEVRVSGVDHVRIVKCIRLGELD